jgi:hypothetical protein
MSVAKRRSFVRVGAASAAAFVAACLVGIARADSVDDAMAAVRAEFAALKQDEYEKIFGDRQAKLGQLPFRDQEYGVAAALGKEAGWTAPTKLYVFKPSTAGGPVYFATWGSGKKAEAQPSVAVVVERYVCGDVKAPQTTKIGDADVPNSDAFALVQALAREWAKGLETPPAPPAAPADGAPAAADASTKDAEFDRQSCVEATKKQAGVATVFAARQGRVTATKKRERREWFGWSGGDASWIVCVRYDESVISKSNPAMTKGSYFVGNVHVYKGVSAK